MGYDFCYSGSPSVRTDAEAEAVAVIGAGMGRGNDDTMSGAIREMFPDADVQVPIVEDGVATYEFSGSGRLLSDLEDTLRTLARHARYRIECQGEDDYLWLYVGTEGRFHDVSGEIVYQGEADLRMDAPVPGSPTA